MIINILNNLKARDRYQKQVLMVISDLLFLPISLFISISLKAGLIWPIEDIIQYWHLFFITPMVSIPLYIHYGLYRWVLKYMGYQVIIATIKAISVSTILLITITIWYPYWMVPYSNLFILWFVSILVIIGSRYIMKYALYFTEPLKSSVGIYGSGKAGAQLIDNLRSSLDYIPVALFDDSPSKWGTVVNSLFVYSSEEIGEQIKRKKIKLILLAILNISQDKRRKILQKISRFPVEVRIVTSIENIITGKIKLDQIRRVDVEDILGREKVKPNIELLNKNVKGKNILITGAGGSIGYEISLQISKLKPKKIILFDNSEYSLYKVHLELSKLAIQAKIIPILSSVNNYLKLFNLMKDNKIDTVYHSAAYKHVPLVEANALDGINNNIIGTFNCVKAANDAKVHNFIFISTNKAIKPKSIMGVTKRFSELIVQAADKKNLSATCYTMVRFGNVIDSAGSVAPLFRKQIQNGGPLTITHPEATRYFMSISEAVELVIQAGAMSKGGEIFVLDMGTPIKIVDLAEKMIHLSGRVLRNNLNPNGDIELKITGLRAGEKINEELFIGENIYSTEHINIFKSKEDSFSWEKIDFAIHELNSAIESQNLNLAIQILSPFIESLKKTKSDLELKMGSNETFSIETKQNIAES
tara:strand:- start:2347 stop:4278 length:1932 start_codon:yes stop_codon:yes gene_type:complete